MISRSIRIFLLCVLAALAGAAIYWSGTLWPEHEIQINGAALRTDHGAAAPTREPGKEPSKDFVSPSSGSEKIAEELLAVVRTDIAEAFRRISRITPVSRQRALRELIAASVLSHDFGRLREVFGFLPEPLEREGVLAVIVPPLASRDADATLAIIRTQLTGDTLNQGLRFVVQAQLREGAYQAAAETQLSMPFSTARENAMCEIATHIAEGGLTVAMEWIRALQPGDEQPQARSYVSRYFAERLDYPALESLLANATDPNERRLLAGKLVGRYRSLSDPACVEFLNSLPPSERSLASVAQVLGDETKSPSEKLAIAPNISTDDARSVLVSAVMSREVAKDPNEAVRISLSVPEELRRIAVGNLVVEWAKIDSEATSVWIQQLASGPVRDTAARVLALQIVSKDRAAANEVAGWVGDPKTREVLLSTLKTR